jgi:hypothetical protein
VHHKAINELLKTFSINTKVEQVFVEGQANPIDTTAFINFNSETDQAVFQKGDDIIVLNANMITGIKF